MTSAERLHTCMMDPEDPLFTDERHCGACWKESGEPRPPGNWVSWVSPLDRVPILGEDTE